jgi:hypothetical protein
MRCFGSLIGKNWCLEMRNRALTTIVRASCRVYCFLLLFYPSTLRCRFGSHMADVFEQQIRGECEQHGVPGVARVWSCVASELIQNAAPREFHWERIGISIASLLTTLALFEGLLRATKLSTHCIK